MHQQVWPGLQRSLCSGGYHTGARERPTELRYSNTHLDTIFALSTHPGKAGVAVIRVSGPQAEAVWWRVVDERSTRQLEECYVSISDPDLGTRMDRIGTEKDDTHDIAAAQTLSLIHI